MVNGVLFRVRTGVPWRDLPERYGSWKTVYERHRRWSADGTWDRILHSVQADADLAQARVALAADTAAAKTQLELDAQQLGQQLADRLAGRTR